MRATSVVEKLTTLLPGRAGPGDAAAGERGQGGEGQGGEPEPDRAHEEQRDTRPRAGGQSVPSVPWPRTRRRRTTTAAAASTRSTTRWSECGGRVGSTEAPARGQRAAPPSAPWRPRRRRRRRRGRPVPPMAGRGRTQRPRAPSAASASSAAPDDPRSRPTSEKAPRQDGTSGARARAVSSGRAAFIAPATISRHATDEIQADQFHCGSRARRERLGTDRQVSEQRS